MLSLRAMSPAGSATSTPTHAQVCSRSKGSGWQDIWRRSLETDQHQGVGLPRTPPSSRLPGLTRRTRHGDPQSALEKQYRGGPHPEAESRTKPPQAGERQHPANTPNHHHTFGCQCTAQQAAAAVARARAPRNNLVVTRARVDPQPSGRRGRRSGQRRRSKRGSKTTGSGTRGARTHTRGTRGPQTSAQACEAWQGV